LGIKRTLWKRLLPPNLEIGFRMTLTARHASVVLPGGAGVVRRRYSGPSLERTLKSIERIGREIIPRFAQ
jgi:hypothetical protein